MDYKVKYKWIWNDLITEATVKVWSNDMTDHNTSK